MAKLSEEQLRALLFLARHQNGCNRALLMARSFPTEMLEERPGEGLGQSFCGGNEDRPKTTESPLLSDH
jgi:hypothetical protein